MKEETPIFETVAPGEVYILYTIDGCVEYIANIDGKAMLKRACPEETP